MNRFVFSIFGAWPVSQYRMGYETAISWDIGGITGAIIVCIQAGVAILALDAYLYWKHRMLHSKLFWGIPYSIAAALKTHNAIDLYVNE
jgi:sterol desaturase/sphingolipid hydroxylase (fatty acid hydroxylase superfamily)